MTLSILFAALTVFRVDPWSAVPFLPDADPAGGVVSDSLAFAAAKGEIEAVSFVVKSDEDVPQVDVVVSALAGDGGATIPADAADVASVKVWFRPGGRWMSTWRADQEHPAPINNLVLHDDSLVRVDWANKVNYLRVDYADGPAYVNVSQREQDPPFNDGLEPVRDAAKFVPFDLKANFRQQYLVTWKVPKDAKAGAYKGTVSLVSRPKDGAAQAVKTLAVALEVHPFALPRPRTHYDTSAPYFSYWMGMPTLGRFVQDCRRLDVAERKLRAILRNMADHNADLREFGELTVDSTDDYALRTLLIARQEGMPADVLLNGLAFENCKFVSNHGGVPLVAEEHPEDYAKVLAAFRERMKTRNAILDRHLGHHRCFYSNGDECSYRETQRCYGFWNIVHELGGLTWTDYGDPYRCAAFTDMNDVSNFCDYKTAWKWHGGGGRAVTYAGPFTGLENPDVWRRTKGLRYWYADFDGLDEYLLTDNNRWNDFIPRDRYCRFGIFYRTYDGLVSTLAWEAVREGLDDVRYCTLLRRQAERALASKDDATRRLGREAFVWQDAQDPELVLDLDAFRRETAKWIVRLTEKVGPLPEDPDGSLPPPATLPPDSRGQKVPTAADGAAAVFAYAEKASRSEWRDDLALEALGRLLKDGKTTCEDFVKATLRVAEIRLGLLDRGAALAALDAALARRDVVGADRGKLLLARVTALTTNVKCMEKFTDAQLAEATKAVLQALKQPGLSEKDRYEAIASTVRAHVSGGAVAQGEAFFEARLKDTKLDDNHQSDVYATLAEGWRLVREWKKALRDYAEAHRLRKSARDKNFLRRVLPGEAEAAEKAKDYVRASTCWQRLIPLYGGEEADYKKRAQRNVQRLQPLVSKTNRISADVMESDDAVDGISLDL